MAVAIGVSTAISALLVAGSLTKWPAVYLKGGSMNGLIPQATSSLERLAIQSRLARGAVALYYKGLVAAEAALARVQPEDNVLCIGGGPFPYRHPAAQTYSASVTVIDNDNQSVALGKGLLESLGYGAQIRFLPGDGRAFPLDGSP